MSYLINHSCSRPELPSSHSSHDPLNLPSQIDTLLLSRHPKYTLCMSYVHMHMCVWVLRSSAHATTILLSRIKCTPFPASIHHIYAYIVLARRAPIIIREIPIYPNSHANTTFTFPRSLNICIMKKIRTHTYHRAYFASSKAYIKRNWI